MKTSLPVLVTMASFFVGLGANSASAAERRYVLDADSSDHVCLVNESVNGKNQQSAIRDQFSLTATFGRQYLTVLRFGNSRMPKATKATLWLANINQAYAPGGMYLWQISTVWTDNTDWATTILRGKKLTYLEPPWYNSWKVIDITSLYNNWRNGSVPNQGLALTSSTKNQNVNCFTMPTVTPASLRPILVVQYDGSKHFCFPLDGGWQAARDGGYEFGDYWLPETEKCLDGGLFKHTGIDWAANAGDPVYAMENGIVKYANGNDPKWGGYVSIEHVTNATFVSTYTHVIPIAGIVEGVNVTRGQKIGYIYDLPSGPHLHFQVHNGAFDLNTSLFGRLPEVSCLTKHSPVNLEPAWPLRYVDPNRYPWD